MISIFESSQVVGRTSSVVSFDGYKCVANFNGCFSGDKLIEQTDKYVIILDGIILNKSEFRNAHKDSDWVNCLVTLYEEIGEQFFSSLRGSFVGAFYDIGRKKWIIFRNALGGVPLYYSTTDSLYV